MSANGFRRIAEVWAIYFQRQAGKEMTKIAIKQSFDISAFSKSGPREDETVRIGDSRLSSSSTQGRIQSKGKTIEWDLAMNPRQNLRFNLIPAKLQSSGIIINQAETLAEDLVFTGTTEINGEKVTWTEASGMSAFSSSPHFPESWVWGQCNTFTDEQDRAMPFVFEGITSRVPILGRFLTTQLSAFFFYYQDESYQFNSAWNAIRLKSEATLTEWKFQADRDDLSFRGQIKAEYKDFAGLQFEDTNGSFLYCANSKLSSALIHVYRRGKLEATLKADGSAAFEVASRDKNPYVPPLI